MIIYIYINKNKIDNKKMTKIPQITLKLSIMIAIYTIKYTNNSCVNGSNGCVTCANSN